MAGARTREGAWNRDQNGEGAVASSPPEALRGARRPQTKGWARMCRAAAFTPAGRPGAVVPFSLHTQLAACWGRPRALRPRDQWRVEMSISNRTPNARLVLSVLVLAAVTINLFVPIVPRGEWRDAAVGINLGQLALVDPLSGDSIDFQHPALLYFFRDDCRFCPHSARRLIRYAGEAASES